MSVFYRTIKGILVQLRKTNVCDVSVTLVLVFVHALGRDALGKFVHARPTLGLPLEWE